VENFTGKTLFWPCTGPVQDCSAFFFNIGISFPKKCFLNGKNIWPTMFVKSGFVSSLSKEKLLPKLVVQRSLFINWNQIHKTKN
jgi:hypothetical protein